MTLCDKCVKMPYCDIYRDIMFYEQDPIKESELEIEKKEPCQECKWYEMSNETYFLHNCWKCKMNDYMYFKSKS